MDQAIRSFERARDLLDAKSFSALAEECAKTVFIYSKNCAVDS